MLELTKKLYEYGVQLDIQPRPEGVFFIFGKGEKRLSRHLDLNDMDRLCVDIIEPTLLASLSKFMKEYESSR